MDGKGRCMDNIFIERLWRSLKYEEVYLHAYGNVAEAKAGIRAWLVFYNEERQHQSHGYRTPRQVYEAQCRWICGRSALPTGCASPTSRARSKSGEMLAFAHIPTGTTTNTRIDLEGFDGKVNQPLNGDRSRHRNPRGYTLKLGSGCRMIGVHLSTAIDALSDVGPAWSGSSVTSPTKRTPLRVRCGPAAAWRRPRRARGAPR